MTRSIRSGRDGSVACLAVTIIFLLLSLGARAQNTSFTQKTSASSFPNDFTIEVDLNGDGIPDLVHVLTDSATGTPSPHALTVQLGHGDGTFGAPTNYANNLSGFMDAGAVTADFNRDGKADIVLPIIVQNGSGGFNTEVEFYLGNGNGTLAAPTSTTISGAIGQIAVADLNRDGNPDLIVANETTNTIAVMLGDGHGNFGAPQTVQTFTSNQVIRNFAVGDFDADSNADLAYILLNCPCETGFVQSSEIHILYGSGTGAFSLDQVAFSTADADPLFELTSGDINLDGATDLVAGIQSSSNNLVLVFGSPKRTPTANITSSGTAIANGSGQARMFIADLNGDLRNDIGFYALLSGTPAVQLLLQTGGGGFASQAYSLPSGKGIGAFVTSDFDRNRKPDFGTLVFTQGAVTSGTDSFLAFVNTTPGGHFAPCSFPAAARGLHACTPGASSTVTSPVHFTASGTWFETLRKSELWIDGTKVAEQHFGWDKSQWFDQMRQLSTGGHKATFFTAGYDNQLQKTSFTFTVSGTQGCSHPSSVGIHVCAPTNGSIWGGAVLAQAAATESGTAGHMELWVDGVKKFSQSGSTLKTSITLTAGLHRFVFIAVNTAGTKISTTLSATVQ
jgi:VCBS repeat protein